MTKEPLEPASILYSNFDFENSDSGVTAAARAPAERARQRRIRAKQFAAEQALSREWIAFRDIAEWCAQEADTIQPDEARRVTAYERLLRAALDMSFETDGESQIIFCGPDNDAEEFSSDDVVKVAKAFGGDFKILTQAYLQWFWIPVTMARQWLTDRKIEFPPWLDADAASRRTGGHSQSAALAESTSASPSRKPRGNSFRDKDGPLIKDMRRLVETDHITVESAARAVCERATGPGTAESKKKRLTGLYHRTYPPST